MARPSIPAHQRRVCMDITISPEIREAIENLSKQLRMNRSRVAESLIERGLRTLPRPNSPTPARS